MHLAVERAGQQRSGSGHEIPVRLWPHSHNARLRQHSDAQWLAMFPHIQRLYMQEERPLKEVVSLMEQRYGFKATERMYKRRLVRWKMFKYAPRKRTRDSQGPTDLTSSRGYGVLLCPGSCHQKVEPVAIDFILPRYSPLDQSSLAILYSIRDWTETHFELRCALRSAERSLSGTHVQGSPEVYSAFALASALYSRGAGHLAGKAVRKGFIAAENAIRKMDVKIIWNFVDVAYEMIQQKQTKLLKLFVSHIAALCIRFLSGHHPVAKAFRQLALMPEKDQVNIIEQAWRCNIDSLSQFVTEANLLYYALDPWDRVLKEHFEWSSRNPELTEAGHDNPNNAMIIRGLTQFVRETELMKRNPFNSISPNADRIDEFQETRIRNTTLISIIDVFSFSQTTLEELREPLSLGKKLGLTGYGLALKGRIPQLLANKDFEATETSFRHSIQMLESMPEESHLEVLQQLCALEGVFYQAGNLKQARSVGGQVIEHAKAYLADIPDTTA
ncbi:Clr5 domain-containing protein [Xylariales sp. AK1849]|nr:Clr5 domain-containing protein [Xylariales sp. AK1849]